MNIKMLVVVFLYLIFISISTCPIFRLKKRQNNHNLYSIDRIKVKNRRVSNSTLLLKIKNIKDNFLENFILKPLRRENYETK
jgi:hypothetical protein